jgi:hypothetical protein
VQWGLGVGAHEGGVDVGAGTDEGLDGLPHVGVVTGPVGDDVEQRARALLAAFLTGDPRRGELGVILEKAAECGLVAGADGGADRGGERVVVGEGGHGGHLRWAVQRLAVRLAR